MFELVTCTLPFLTIFGYPLNLISIVSPNKKASQLTLEGFVERDVLIYNNSIGIIIKYRLIVINNGRSKEENMIKKVIYRGFR
jgi:hypothetical protein